MTVCGRADGMVLRTAGKSAHYWCHDYRLRDQMIRDVMIRH